MSELFFYEKIVALDKNQHRNLRFSQVTDDFYFAAKTNSLLLSGFEFFEAAKEYPIVFSKTPDQNIVPVALVGLRNNENNFIDSDGKWKARYIPAFVRRYPFVLAEQKDSDDLTVCIDEEYTGFVNGDGDGNLLFDNDGGQTKILANILAFLQEYNGQNKRTSQFTKMISEMDLFVEYTAKIDLKNGETFAIGNLLIIDEKKLLQIDKDRIYKLFQKGELSWIYYHIMSLSNMGRLMDMVS